MLSNFIPDESRYSPNTVNTIAVISPIPIGFFGNFVRLGEGMERARVFCLIISRQLLALELSFKFV